MRQLNLVSPRKLEWFEVPDPELESPTDALVRPLTVATCDLDAAVIRGETPAQAPFPFGHEGVGEVVAVGEAVSSVRPGDLVSIPFQVSCGSCAQCSRGRTAHCTAVPRMSMYGLGSLSGAPWGGFLSDLVRVPFADHMLLPIPPGVDPLAVASLSDNIADAWRTVGPALHDEPGASVLIVGGASSSLYAAGIAIALGASEVAYSGGGEREWSIASSMGATVLEGPFPHRWGSYPITTAQTTDRAGLHCAVRSTATDGTCTSTGIHFQDLTPLPLLEMYSKGIHFITGRVHARTVMPKALELVRSGAFCPEVVTSAVVDWEAAPEALAGLNSKLVFSRLGAQQARTKAV